MMKRLNNVYIENLNVSGQGWTGGNQILIGCMATLLLMTQLDRGIRDNISLARNLAVHYSNREDLIALNWMGMWQVMIGRQNARNRGHLMTLNRTRYGAIGEWVMKWLWLC